MAKSKLTENDKIRIGQLYFDDHKSQVKIAQLYDVAQSTIHQVIKEQGYLREIQKRDDTLVNVATIGATFAATNYLQNNKPKSDNNFTPLFRRTD